MGDTAVKTLFDPMTHTYTIAGRIVPSVTQVLREVMGDAIWHATEWHLQRGRAVHAAMALLAQGKQFEYDPQIEQQVKAGKKFFAEMRPKAISVEQPVFSEPYQAGGSYDLLARFPKKGINCLIDYKSALSEVAKVQLGGYAVILPGIHWGMVVALLENGNYKSSGVFRLDQYRNEFMACLSVFNIRKRLGLIKTKEEDKHAK